MSTYDVRLTCFDKSAINSCNENNNITHTQAPNGQASWNWKFHFKFKNLWHKVFCSLLFRSWCSFGRYSAFSFSFYFSLFLERVFVFFFHSRILCFEKSKDWKWFILHYGIFLSVVFVSGSFRWLTMYLLCNARNPKWWAL